MITRRGIGIRRLRTDVDFSFYRSVLLKFDGNASVISVLPPEGTAAHNILIAIPAKLSPALYVILSQAYRGIDRKFRKLSAINASVIP